MDGMFISMIYIPFWGVSVMVTFYSLKLYYHLLHFDKLLIMENILHDLVAHLD